MRSGLSHHAFEHDLGARHDQRRDQRERGGRRIGRHHDRAPAQLRLAVERDAAAVRAHRLDPHARRRNARSIRSVWSRVASLLDHRGRAGRREAGEQHRRLELRRGGRRLVDDRDRVARALRASAAAGRPRRRSSARAPIRSSGSRMRRIGRLRSEASPSKVAVIGQPGDRPDHQAAAGAGIAEIERRGAARRSPPTPTPWTRQAPSPVRSTVAPSAAHGLGGVDARPRLRAGR